MFNFQFILIFPILYFIMNVNSQTDFPALTPSTVTLTPIPAYLLPSTSTSENVNTVHKNSANSINSQTTDNTPAPLAQRNGIKLTNLNSFSPLHSTVTYARQLYHHFTPSTSPTQENSRSPPCDANSSSLHAVPEQCLTSDTPTTKSDSVSTKNFQATSNSQYNSLSNSLPSNPIIGNNSPQSNSPPQPTVQNSQPIQILNYSSIKNSGPSTNQFASSGTNDLDALDDAASLTASCASTDDLNIENPGHFLKFIQQFSTSLSNYLYTNNQVRLTRASRSYINNKFDTLHRACSMLEEAINNPSNRESTTPTNVLPTVDTPSKRDFGAEFDALKNSLASSLEGFSTSLVDSLPQLINEAVKKNFSEAIPKTISDAVQKNLSVTIPQSINSALPTIIAPKATPAPTYTSILLQGKDRQKDNDQLKRDLLSVPCPKDVNIHNIKALKNGTLKITCKESNAEKLLPSFLKSKVAENFNIKPEPKKKLPLIIFNVSKNYKAENVRALITNNCPGLKDGDISITKNFPSRSGNTNWVFTVDVDSAKFLVEKRKLFNNFYHYIVKKYISFQQCWKCLQVGHSSSNCHYTSGFCCRCGDKHHLSSHCHSSELQCINCCQKNANVGKLAFTTNHNALDKSKCHYLRDELKRVHELQKTI